MNKQAKIDPRTLSWIKQEVAEMLNSICQPLETFVVNDDASVLVDCVESIRKVRGAVDMVEITGAVLLAREMEQVATALAAGKLALKKDAAEALMRGAIQLPAYLEHLYSGNADVPIILLPMLNDFRAVQNKELLTEGAFFFADMSVHKPSLINRSADAATWDLGTIAKKLRPAYLAALLNIFRGIEVVKNLKVVATVILNLEQASTLEKCEQFWWVSAGLVHSLHDKGLELSIAVKIMLGRIDRQIKRVIDNGEEALQAKPPEDIIKNLLYYISRSTSRAVRVQDLKKAFKLDQAMLEAGAVSDARDQLIGFNANLMANVSSQIKEEMLRIKDEMDIAMNANKGDPNSLAPVCDRLRVVADTLDMLGLQLLAQLAREQENFLQELMENDAALHDQDVMHVAGALLYIESSLFDLGVSGSLELLQGSDRLDRAGTELPEAEFRQLAKLAASEAVAELMKVKDAFGRFVVDPSNASVLQDSGEYLNLARGALAMLGHDRPARIVDATQQYLSIELLDKKTQPSARSLDLIANAVGAVDYFLESLLEKAVAPEAGLVLAERSLTELGYPVRGVTRDSATGYIAASSVAKAGNAKPVVTQIKAARPVDSTEPAVEVDQELIAVFLTEADDEVAAISANLERWRTHAADQDSLTALIRSYHTLKGAGRIIGASSVGVLAWSVEELLRRVLDGRVQSTAKLLGLLDRSVTVFTQLVAQIKRGNIGGGPPVQALIDLARELRQPAQMTGR